MKLNVNAVLAREAEKKDEVKPLPKVRVVREHQPPKASPVLPQSSSPVQTQLVLDEKEQILKDLWTEMSVIKKARGKLSTNTAYLVQQIEGKLRGENASVAKAFAAGDLPAEELKDHYSRIQEYTDQAAAVFDKIRYVEQHGVLPLEAESTLLKQTDERADAIQHTIRRLDDLIYKTNRKLTTGKPKNMDRMITWRERLAMAEAQREDLRHKLKRLQYEARAQRTGE